MSYTEYYLEDCVQMLKFIPPPNDSRKKNSREDVPDDDEQEVWHSFWLSVSLCQLVYQLPQYLSVFQVPSLLSQILLIDVFC